MPQDTPPELIAASRRLESAAAWLWLFEVLVDEATVVRVAKNPTDVVFAGATYEGWNLELQGFTVSEEEDASANATIRLAHPSAALRALLEAHDDFVDRDVIVRIAHGDYLAQGYTLGQPQRWQIHEAHVGRDGIEWRLGLVDIYDRDLPQAKFSRDQCRHDYGNRHGGCPWPIDLWPHFQAVLEDNRFTEREFKTCDLGYGSRNGCLRHAEMATLAGIEPNVWPQFFGGQRGIKKIRQ